MMVYLSVIAHVHDLNLMVKIYEKDKEQSEALFTWENCCFPINFPVFKFGQGIRFS
jgi:hypothetical protein